MITTIPGALFHDDRGVLKVVNDFDFQKAGIRRFYQVENNSACQIRAWHGHRAESKFCFCVQGSAIIATVPIEYKNVAGHTGSKSFPNIEGTSRNVLSGSKPQILHIPAGNYNGFRTLEPNTILQFFSTSTLEESKGDDIRQDADYFGNDIWNVVAR